MKNSLIGGLLGLCLAGTLSCSSPSALPKEVKMSRPDLLYKIAGGWAGQTIGCAYGGPTEFRYQGDMIPDSVPIAWKEGCMQMYYREWSGLFDDVYMDLTFVDVFSRLGLDAPADSFAVAYATAGYGLWHGNQGGRYNVLRGVMPPESGHWLNNPHADDLDFQIEADFAGLMSPGMPNTAAEFCDRIGHIMAYGNGWYGGVYVAAMYSLAFVTDSIELIVTEALKTIPEQSSYHACISDVIRWYRENPDDWKKTWELCEAKWSDEAGCPEGALHCYNIDATLNSAYVVMGLLYGGGDFTKTMEISTRCGQDSDCNPATAAGILGTLIGYDRIPRQYLDELSAVEGWNFQATHMSLADVYQEGAQQALAVIECGGGTVSGDSVTIRCQQPKPVRFEQSFEGLYAKERSGFAQPGIDPYEKVDGFFGRLTAKMDSARTEPVEMAFEGTGVVLRGVVNAPEDYVARLEVTVDGVPAQVFELPASFRTRSNELYWNYQLPKGSHTLRARWLNPDPKARIFFGEALVYTDEPQAVNWRENDAKF